MRNGIPLPDSQLRRATGRSPSFRLIYQILWGSATLSERVYGSGIVLAPGGNLAAAGSADGVIRLWNILAVPCFRGAKADVHERNQQTCCVCWFTACVSQFSYATNGDTMIDKNQNCLASFYGHCRGTPYPPRGMDSLG